MSLYSNAIVKRPGQSIVQGIGSKKTSAPDYKKALQQHDEYLEALTRCELKIEVLEEEEEYPDSTFVEDPAIVTERVAVINRLGAPSRQGEERAIRESLKRYFEEVEEIESPGTLEGGDILQIDELFFIGLSKRTNLEGALQLKTILERVDYQVQIIKDLPPTVLHLKSGMAYLGDNNLLTTRDFYRKTYVKGFNCFIVPDDEKYAANSLRINAYVLVPEGYDKTEEMIQRVYPVITVDTSMFRRIDGGLSCLSLRF